LVVTLLFYTPEHVFAAQYFTYILRMLATLDLRVPKNEAGKEESKADNTV
jgi:hypothetical protein